MANSLYHETLTILASEIKPVILTRILEEVNKELPTGQGFGYLMADYWNNPGCFEEYYKALPNIEQDDCISGSAFGHVAELRWRRIGDKLRVVLVAEADLKGLFMKVPDVLWCDGESQVSRFINRKTRSILLWGTKYTDDCQWIEARIPRHLIYPSTPKPGKFDHARLHYKEYRDDRGRMVIYRRTHVTSVRKI